MAAAISAKAAFTAAAQRTSTQRSARTQRLQLACSAANTNNAAATDRRSVLLGLAGLWLAG